MCNILFHAIRSNYLRHNFFLIFMNDIMFLDMYCLDSGAFFLDSHQLDTGLAYTQNLKRLKQNKCFVEKEYKTKVW